MQRVSFGIIVNRLLAYLLQPYEKSKITKAYEKSKITKDLLGQLQGLSNQKNGKKTLIWLHAESLILVDNFSEILSHFEDKKDIQFLLTTEESNTDQDLNVPVSYTHLTLPTNREV